MDVPILHMRVEDRSNPVIETRAAIEFKNHGANPFLGDLL
jgi:hypothetical protein